MKFIILLCLFVMAVGCSAPSGSTDVKPLFSSQTPGIRSSEAIASYAAATTGCDPFDSQSTYQLYNGRFTADAAGPKFFGIVRDLMHECCSKAFDAEASMAENKRYFSVGIDYTKPLTRSLASYLASRYFSRFSGVPPTCSSLVEGIADDMMVIAQNSPDTKTAIVAACGAIGGVYAASSQ